MLTSGRAADTGRHVRATRLVGAAARPFFSARNHNFLRHPLIERSNVVISRAAMELSHHGLLGALGNMDNAPFRAPIGFGAHHLHFHPVAIHGGAHGVRRNEDVLLDALHRRVGNNESIAIAMTDEAATRDVSTSSPGSHGTRASGTRKA